MLSIHAKAVYHMASKVWNLKSSTPEGWNFCKLYLEKPSEINYLWISWPVAEIASLFHSSGCAAHIVWLNTSTAQITSFPFADFFPSRESIQTWILGRALLLGCEWKCGRQGTHWGCSAPGTLIGVLGQCFTVQHPVLPLPGSCLFLCLITPHRKAKGFSSYFVKNGSWKLIDYFV